MSGSGSGSRREGLAKAGTIKRKPVVARAPKFAEVRVVDSTDEESIGRCFPLDGAAYEVGRDEGSAQIADPLMSRRHFRLQPDQTGYTIEDLGGANGTFLDGRRVKGRQPLAGTVISAGDTLMVVEPAIDPSKLPASREASGDEVSEVAGVSRWAVQLKKSIATVAGTGGAVLLLGPTGAGKEIAARAIHRLSGRTGAFIPVNCAAVPAELAEAEFFGHRRGAFTGATEDRAGYFRASSGGTLFLDEVGELPAPIQAKLLRVLEDKTIQPLGGGAQEPVDLRVVAATHVDLAAADSFRRDLLARLGDWVLRLPSLAERRADILVLWTHFLKNEFPRREIRAATTEFKEALLLHSWPANIRELLKTARRLEELAAGDEPFTLDLLPDDLQAPLADRYRETDGAPPGVDPDAPDEATGFPGRAAIEAALRESGGNVTQAATRNDWHRTQIYRWLERLSIDPSIYRRK